MTQAGAIMSLGSIVSTALFGRFLPVNQWIGASKCVPVCSPNVTLFQYQAGPRPSYREISWIRTGAAWPNSGGSTMTGKSGLSVNVRSTTRTAPAETAPASSRRLLLCIVTSSGLVEIPMSPVELALERFRISRETLPDFFGDISDIHLLEPAFETRHDRLRDCARRDLRRRYGLEPLGVDRPGEQIHHPDAAGPELGAKAVRERQARRLRGRVGAKGRPVRQRMDRENVDPRGTVVEAIGTPHPHGGAEGLCEVDEAEIGLVDLVA